MVDLNSSGLNPRKRHGYTPSLIEFSALGVSDEAGETVQIRSTTPGTIISMPIFVKAESIHSLSNNADFIYQFSSELRPYFTCLNELFFKDGLSIKPDYLIGQLPLAIRSPASVFEYEDYVYFLIDPDRRIEGYALVNT